MRAVRPRRDQPGRVPADAPGSVGAGRALNSERPSSPLPRDGRAVPGARSSRPWLARLWRWVGAFVPVIALLGLLAYGFRTNPRDIPSPLLGRPEAAWRAYRDRGIVFVGVNVQDSEPAARAFHPRVRDHVSQRPGPRRAHRNRLRRLRDPRDVLHHAGWADRLQAHWGHRRLDPRSKHRGCSPGHRVATGGAKRTAVPTCPVREIGAHRVSVRYVLLLTLVGSAPCTDAGERHHERDV